VMVLSVARATRLYGNIQLPKLLEIIKTYRFRLLSKGVTGGSASGGSMSGYKLIVGSKN